MNDKYSTTEGKTSGKLSDEAMLSAQWKNIDWHKAEREVNRLQIRIVKATQQKDYNAVKRLQYLLTHSFYAKALAVKRVVTNDGRKTPGVDGVLWNTPAKKMKAVLSLTDKGYRARPLRRVYIEKKDKKKKRPLGIPTMYDRAMQALYALALEPVAETTADGKSFGFRKGRCAQDACEYLFNALSRKHISPKWVLEGDIKGCFDHISHDWLLANIPMDKNILKQFLKSGFIYQRELFPTEEGTPQGGIISPILANMTLDGIEKKLVERFHTNALGKVDSRFKNAHKVNFVRYADDFVVTAATPELALEAKELIREFLAERGLELSDEKTVVTNIDDGFDFLGWNFRKYNEKLIIKPSQKAVKAIVSNISDTILRRGKAWQQDVLIMKLNEQIRGWTNYHQSVCASDAFAHLDYVLYELLWRWAKRRHPKKNKWWISTRYWHRVGNRNWVFSTENKELIRVDSTAIVRHTKIKATANPFLDEAYFQKRKFDKGMHRLTGKFKMIWKNQNGLCYHCGMPMDVTEEREIFYLAPKAKAGIRSVIAVSLEPRPVALLAVRNPKRYIQQTSMLRILAYVLLASYNEQKMLNRLQMAYIPTSIQSSKDIYVSLFGELSISTSKGVLKEADFSSPRISRLISYLLISRKNAISPQEITQTLWPDDSDNPAKNVKGLIYRLRQKFSLISDEPLILSSASGYQLNPELHIMTDYQRFDELVSSAARASSVINKVDILKNALDLYRGKVLSSADGEHWLIQFSTKYHLSYMGAVSELLKQLDYLHSYDLLNQYAMKSLTIAPDNPKAYGWLIRSLKAQGMNELATNELAAAKEHLTTEEYEEILAFGANW